jgi:multimeric flavodoxin WrbA
VGGTGGGPRRVLVLGSSPRRDGNSWILAEQVAAGAADAGNHVDLVYLPDRLRGTLRDCRECRAADGSCTIDDGYRDLFLGEVLAADALVYATPLYWYGMSGTLKTFFDRMFCYIAHSYPASDHVVERLSGKRTAAVISSEETYLGACLGVIHQLQEMSRYLHHEFAGVVTGIGNRRGDVRRDPAGPLAAARALGGRLFELRVTDYRIDTDRPASTWAE